MKGSVIVVKQCKLCDTQLLIVHPSRGRWLNKSSGESLASQNYQDLPLLFYVFFIGARGEPANKVTCSEGLGTKPMQ